MKLLAVITIGRTDLWPSLKVLLFGSKTINYLIVLLAGDHLIGYDANATNVTCALSVKVSDPLVVCLLRPPPRPSGSCIPCFRGLDLLSKLERQVRY